MADDTDQDSKTEEPTSKRMGDAREKGQVATSREVGTALLFLSALGLFSFRGEILWDSLQNKMRFFLGGFLTDGLTNQGIVALVRDMIVALLTDLAPYFLLFLVVGVFSSIIQHGFLISLEPIIPKLSKINPIQGLKRLFSMRSLVELVKSIIKMAVISVAVYWAIKDSAEGILRLTATSMTNFTHTLAKDSLEVLMLATMAFLGMALLDFIYQQYNHIKGLRMTKQEVKDEQKQMEGDPMVKGRIRQIQREMAQRRMMEEVPKADVVITNPTHYAVALVYKQGAMMAPRLVAKGRGRTAERIRAKAREHRVPLVENPPLARSLYKEVALEQMVPPQLFKAVAQVLAYVYGLKRRTN